MSSCTGGLLAAALTDVPGISGVFLAGTVAYQNEAKMRDLGVPEGVITKHGAVSVPPAKTSFAANRCQGQQIVSHGRA